MERVSFTSQLESSSRFHLNHKTVDLITVIICLKVSSFPYFLQTLLISDCSAHTPYPVFFNRYIVFLNTFKEQSLTKSSPLCWTRQTQLNFLTKRMVKDGVVYLVVSCGEKCRTSYNELVQKHLEQEEADLPATTCLGNTFSIHTVRLRITQQLHFTYTFNWLLHQVWTESTNGFLSSIIHITNKIRWPFRGSRGEKKSKPKSGWTTRTTFWSTSWGIFNYLLSNTQWNRGDYIKCTSAESFSAEWSSRKLLGNLIKRRKSCPSVMKVRGKYKRIIYYIHTTKAFLRLILS